MNQLEEARRMKTDAEASRDALKGQLATVEEECATEKVCASVHRNLSSSGILP